MAAGGMQGSFAELRELTKALGDLGSPKEQYALSALLSEEARTQALIGFQRGVDPYDQPWKPLTSRVGQPLSDTGRLRNSITARGAVQVMMRGFVITTRLIYAAVHQYGATIRAKNARFRFGGAGSSDADMVTAGKPMLVFRVGGPRPRTKGRWVQKEKVTIPRRQFMPEDTVGPRWLAGFEQASRAFIASRLKGKTP